jgi:hypothetical protein
MRKKLGIQPGGTMTIEETAEGVLLNPAIQISVELEVYSDEDIARWHEEDRVDEDERDRLLKLLAARSQSQDE